MRRHACDCHCIDEQPQSEDGGDEDWIGQPVALDDGKEGVKCDSKDPDARC